MGRIPEAVPTNRIPCGVIQPPCIARNWFARMSLGRIPEIYPSKPIPCVAHPTIYTSDVRANLKLYEKWIYSPAFLIRYRMPTFEWHNPLEGWPNPPKEWPNPPWGWPNPPSTAPDISVAWFTRVIHVSLVMYTHNIRVWGG